MSPQTTQSLEKHVLNQRGNWEQTIIKGAEGFRFHMEGQRRLWELRLQPELGAAQGVQVSCRPDFLLTCDDGAVPPVAIFTDGFEFHCFPNNRIADDLRKRRAILDSGNYLVWSVNESTMCGVGWDLVRVSRKTGVTSHENRI